MSQASKSIVKSEAHPVAIAQNPVILGSDLNVAALVCVAAFAPDKPESVSTLIAYVSQPKAVASIIEAVWRMSHE